MKHRRKHRLPLCGIVGKIVEAQEKMFDVLVAVIPLLALALWLFVIGSIVFGWFVPLLINRHG